MGFRLLAVTPILALVCALPLTATAERGSPSDPPELCAPPQSVCRLDTGIQPVVSLRWQETSKKHPRHRAHTSAKHRRKPAPRGRVASVRRWVHLVAENESDRAVHAQVGIYPWGMRDDVRPPQFNFALGPGERRKLPIDVTALGFDLSRRQSLVALRAVVQTYADPGRVRRLDQVISPTLYLLRRNPRSATLRAFDESRLDQLVNRPAQSANPICTLVAPPGPDDELELTSDAGPGDPQPDHIVSVNPPAGPGDIKFCFALPVETKDAGIGEDFGVLPITNYPASFAKVDITSLPPQAAKVVDGEFLDAEGCISFTHVSDPGYSVVLRGLAAVPRSDDASESNLLAIRTEAGYVPTWSWCSDEDLEPGDVKWFYANPNRRTNLLALGTFSLLRFSDGVGGESITVRDKACSTIPTNSCNSSSGNVEVHPDHNQYRYAISHEIGHAVMHRFLGQHPHRCGMYTANGGGAACEWNLSHALHSKEFSASAATEGFAQFFATAVWNRINETDAWFHYYKDDYKNGDVKVVDMEFDSVGGSIAYLDNICQEPVDGFGVELDWGRQFWDYLTNSGSKPTKLQILEQLELAFFSEQITPSWNRGNIPHRMTQATTIHAGGAFAERWADFAAVNGVDVGFNANCSWDCDCTDTTACSGASCPCSDCAP